MNLTVLLSELEQRHVRPVLSAGRLKLVGPRAAITPDLLERVRQYKPRLLVYLRAREVAREAEAQGRDPVDYLRERCPDLLDEPEDGRTRPAESILATCARYGIILRLEPDGALVVGQPRGPGAWPSLRTALEAHIEAIAKLVESGWHLRADMKATIAA